MNNEVGIYRGSFDPPHNGHFEAVNHALQAGMTSVTIIYKDINRFKPFRSSNKVRKEFLKIMFDGMQNVMISNKTYKTALIDLLSDPTIIKIYQIVGSDLLDKPVRPIKLPTKLAYFIHLRDDYPLLAPMTTWNNLPVKIGDAAQFNKQSYSSSHLRSLLFERNFQDAKLGFHPTIFNQILSHNFFVSTDNEYRFRTILQEVKKIVEQEIVSKDLVHIDKYPLSFHLGSDIGISGLSGDIVCFIKDRDQTMRLAIKIFLGDDYKSNFESELSGYETLTNLNLKLVRVPQLFFSHQKENFAFIGMSFVSGTSLAEMMHDSPEAIRLCARANLELHMAQRFSTTEIPMDQIAIFEKAIKMVVNRLTSIQISFLPPDIISKLTTRWSQIHKSFVANPGLLSFTHGDPNHSNWIVDLNNKCVTYIDLSLFKHSISPQKTPYGFAINELEESLLTFWIAAKRIGGFSNEKIQEVQNTYKNEYMAYAPPDITTIEARHYFTSYWSLRVIENLLAKMIESNSQEAKLKYQTHLLNKIESFLNDNDLSQLD